MELRQLRYFTAVADEGGFGRAAERLHIVQSAVSQQISRLERELGVELFDRSARRVKVTPAGERLLLEARAVLDAADRTRRVAATLAAGEEGVLRLGTVHGPGDRIYRLLDRLAGIAPRLEVRPERRPPQARLAAVRSRALDAAVVGPCLPRPSARALSCCHCGRIPCTPHCPPPTRSRWPRTRWTCGHSQPCPCGWPRGTATRPSTT